MGYDVKPTFTYSNAEPCFTGKLSYVPNDYALRFVPLSNTEGAMGQAVLAFDTLEILIDIASRRLLYAQGYFPSTSWAKDKLPLVNAVKGSVYIGDEAELIKSVGLSVDVSGWKRVYDANSSWLYYGVKNITDGEVSIEIAQNVIVSLYSGAIVAVWMKVAKEQL